MNDFSDKILDKLETGQIKPKSKKFFFLIKAIWLLLIAGAVVIGAWACALMIFLTGNQSWSALLKTSDKWQNIFLSVPYWWLVILAMLAWLSYYYFKHLGKGYRQSMTKVLLVVFGLNLIFGGLLYWFGWAERADIFLSQRSSIYTQSLDTRSTVWNRPGQGYLSGEIFGIGDDWLVIVDGDGDHWTVAMSTSTMIENGAEVIVGKKIKVLGNQAGAGNFVAQEIRPWTCGCGGQCGGCGCQSGGCGCQGAKNGQKENTCGMRIKQ